MSEFKLVSEPFLDSDQAAAILRIHPRPFNASRDAVVSPATASGSCGRFTPPTWKAVTIASLPHSTPTLPSGTL